VTRPRQSYVLWFSQRVGSTVLARTLEDTGVAGRPREWLNDDTGAGLLAKYRVDDAFALRAMLWTQATTANGVLGVKYGMDAENHRRVVSLFGQLDPAADGRAVWDAWFPACKHVVMTRRDKVRLAASWWRAIQTGEWHRPSGAAPAPVPDLIDRYDAGAIAHLVREAETRDADIHAELARWGVTAHAIAYEDLVERYAAVVGDLLAFLELRVAAIPPPALARTADAVTEAWSERYRRERASAPRARDPA